MNTWIELDSDLESIKYLGIAFDRFYSLSSNQALQHSLKQAHLPWQAQFLATEIFQYLKFSLNSSFFLDFIHT